MGENKKMKVLILSVLMMSSTASFARESLFKAELPKEQTSEALKASEAPRPPVKAISREKKPLSEGNLSFQLREARLVGGEAGIVSAKSLGLKHPKLRPGMSLVVELTGSVVAFKDSKTPVVAKVLSRDFKGLVVLGEASLEKNSKKIEIKFDRLVDQKEKVVFEFSGYSLVEGEYHTNENKMFLGEFLSAAAAGFVDASIEREQNILGNYNEKPGLDTQGKKALGSALTKSAEKYAESEKNSQEYSLVYSKGIKVIVDY